MSNKNSYGLFKSIYETQDYISIVSDAQKIIMWKKDHVYIYDKIISDSQDIFGYSVNDTLNFNQFLKYIYEHFDKDHCEILKRYILKCI